MNKFGMYLTTIIIAGALLVFGGVGGFALKAVAAHGSKPLTSSEITDLLSGNTIKGKGFVVYYEADGTMRGLDGGYSDSGTWTAADDNLCVKWRKWVKGKELCWKLRREGSKVHREATRNAQDGVVTWHAGNTDNL